MLIGLIKTSPTTTFVRTIQSIDAQTILQKFKAKKLENNGFFHDTHNFVYKTKNEEVVCVVTTDQPHTVEDLLDEFSTEDALYVFDEMVTEFVTLRLPRHEINSALLMESEEEKNLEKNKKAAQFEFKSEKVVLEEKLQKVEIEPKKAPKNIFKATLKNDEDGEVVVAVKQEIKMEIDRNGKRLSGDAEGELSLKVDERHKRVEMLYEANCPVRRIPNLTGALNTLKCVRDWPVGRAVTLLRWRSPFLALPFEFIFWPSEIENEQFSILFEVVAISRLCNLRIFFSIEKLSDVFVESGSAIVDQYLQWTVGDLQPGESSTFEFNCRCADSESVFPVNLCFKGCEESPVVVTKAMLDGEAVEFLVLNSSVFDIKIV